MTFNYYLHQNFLQHIGLIFLETLHTMSLSKQVHLAIYTIAETLEI